MSDNDFILHMLERLNEKMDDLSKQQSATKIELEVHVKTSKITEENIKADTAEIKQALAKQSEHLRVYNQQLKEHMRRTELLESRLNPIEKDFIARTTKKGFVAAHWKKASVMAAVVSSLAAAGWAIVQIVGYVIQYIK